MGWGLGFQKEQILAGHLPRDEREQQDLTSVIAQARNHPTLLPPRCIPSDRLQNPVMLRVTQAGALRGRLLFLPFSSRAGKTSPAHGQVAGTPAADP